MELPHRIKRCTSTRRGIDVAGALFVVLDEIRRKPTATNKWTEFQCNIHHHEHEWQHRIDRKTRERRCIDNFHARVQYCSIYIETAVRQSFQPAHEHFLVFILWMQLNLLIDRNASHRSDTYPVAHCAIERNALPLVLWFYYYIVVVVLVKRAQKPICLNGHGHAIVPHSKCAFYSSNTISRAHNGGRRTHSHYIYIWIVIFIAIPPHAIRNVAFETRIVDRTQTTHHRQFIFCNCFFEFSWRRWVHECDTRDLLPNEPRTKTNY